MSWFASMVAWKIAYERRRIVVHQQALKRWEAWYSVNGNAGAGASGEAPVSMDEGVARDGEHRRELESMYVRNGDSWIYREGCFDPASTQVLRVDASLEAAQRLEDQRREAGVFEDTKPQMLRICGIKEVDVDLSCAVFGMKTKDEFVADTVAGQE